MKLLIRLAFIILLYIANIAAETDIEITSDNIFFDNKTGFYKFGGDVLATDGEYNLKSRDVAYDKENKLLFSEYETIISNSNYLIVSDAIKFSDDFNYSEFSKLHFKISNFGSVFADSALKKESDIILQNTYFTLCRICKQDKFSEPIWKIKSKQTLYNEESDVFTFRHLAFYLYGVPVAYSPYFFANGNQNPKKTGLLYPTIANDSIMGNYVSIPLFINLKSNFDITYTPTIFSKNNINHETEIRHLTNNSNFNFDFAYLNLSQDFRESLLSEGYQLYDKRKWRFKTVGTYNNDLGDFNLNLHRTSNSDYLSRYLGDHRRYERTKIGFLSNDQDLIVKYSYVNDFSDQQRSYYRLPTFNYNKNISFSKNRNFLNNVNYDNVKLEDEQARDRISYINDFSHKLKLNKYDNVKLGVRNRFDGYGLFEETNKATRYQFGVYADWHRNYINKTHNIILTPKFFFGSNNIVKDDNVLNYDSATNNLNFANLMRLNNAFGYDLIDESSKVAFELNLLKSESEKSFEYKFGFKYSDNDVSKYAEGSGLNSKFSDMLNNFSYASKTIRLEYFNRLNYADFFPYYNSVSLNLNFDKFKVATTIAHIEYSRIDPTLVDDKNLSSTISYNLSKNLKIINTANFSYEDQAILSGALTQNYLALIYKNRCVETILSLSNRFYTNNDVKDDSTISVSFSIFNQ
ncbi:hypothetical protein OAP83_00430 [Rickettsiales bacterium]|nr:hypothetical protein [Rickettsiales bacterium]